MCGKSLSKASADYHQDMNAEVFESWLEKQLLPNLPEKCVLVIDNASYHSRQDQKIPTQATKKADMLEFMFKQKIAVPQPVQTKPVLLQKIKQANIEKTYFVDNLVKRMAIKFCACHLIIAYLMRLKGFGAKFNGK